MKKYYYDTPEELLREDSSYLREKNNLSNIFSKAFWVGTKNLEDSFAGTKGNQRESYKAGVKIGWNEAMRKLETNGNNPNPVGFSKQERNEIMFILNALGVSFTYMTEPPLPLSWRESPKYSENSFHPGLNVCKNIEAIESGATVNSDVKNKIIEIIKMHTPSCMHPK